MTALDILEEAKIDKDFSKFGTKFQLATLSLLTQDKTFANKIKLIIKSEYFDNKYNQFLCQTILDFIENYHCQPDFETIKTIIETQVPNPKLYLLALDSIKSIDLSKKEFIELEVVKFCFTRHALSALEEEKNNILLGRFDKARDVAFQKYKPISNSVSEIDLKKDFRKVFNTSARNPVPTPLPSLNLVSKGGPGAGDLCVVVAQSSFGKCFAPGTEIMMYDLSSKKIEDIKVKDKIMGWDGTPRTVQSLAQGQEQMYEIKQGDKTTYTVNESHILVLKPNKFYLKSYPKMTSELVKIEVKDYLKQSKTWKKYHNAVKVGLNDLKFQETLLDPYYLGLWLGDGTSRCQTITNKDKEVIEFLREYANALSLRLSSKHYDLKKDYADSHSIVAEKGGQKNILLDNLKLYNLLQNKHIPFVYLNNDRKTRLELLAGLLDSDGYLGQQCKTNFEITQVNFTLAADIAFLARSLGFRVTETEYMAVLTAKDYKVKAMKLGIFGDVHLIPTKVKRKQAQQHPFKRTKGSIKVKVVKKEIGTYYGFTLSDKDPDRMFLLKNFTVVHNTMWMIALAKHAALIGKKVLFVSLETDNIQLLHRAISSITGITQNDLHEHPELVENKVKSMTGDIRFIELKATQARVDVIQSLIEEKKSEGFFPDMIIIDGLNQLKPPKGERFSNSNDKFEYLAEEVRDMAKELRLPIHISFQSNRGGFNTEHADEQNIGKAIEVYQVCDWMLMFTQSVQMQDSNECFVQLLKNRLGPKGLTLKLHYDPSKVIFEELETINRSLLLDKKLRTDVVKGLEGMKDRLEEFKNKKKI